MNSLNNDDVSENVKSSGDQKEERQTYGYKNNSSKRAWIKNNANTVFNGLLVLFTLVLAVSTVLLWWETSWLRDYAASQATELKASVSVAQRSAEAAEKSAKIAENALIASERPWVNVDVIGVGGPLTYNKDGGVKIALKFVLENVGRSPAIHISIDAELWFRSDIGSDIVPGAGQLRDIEKEIIEKINKRVPIPFGYSLFPKQTLSQNYSLNVPKEVLDQRKHFFEFNGHKKEIQEIGPIVVGTVNYRSVFDDDTHHTTFSVDFERRTSDGLKAILMDGVNIPENDLVLYKSYDSSSYAD